MEADKLFASHHYKHYDFLLLLSDKVGGVGLEHHQSSEDGQHADYLTGWPNGILDRDLLGMSTRTRGTESSAGRQTSGRRTLTCPCGTICSGSTKA